MPRSGTTLFSSILDAHPDIAISPETHFYTRCRHREEGANREPSLEKLWTCLQQQPGFRDMAFSDEEKQRIQERISAGQDGPPAGVLRAVETTYAERSGAEAWGEKTPDHLQHVPDILHDFPDAVVVAIVRDPRDVCLSLRGMPWNYDSLPESALKWRRYARLTEDFRRDYASQFREVRYEDLLEDPERVVRRILEWIGASFDASVLAYHERQAGPADAQREPWKEKAYQSIDPGNKNKWRDQMAPGERMVVERVAGSMMRAKDYVPQSTTIDAALLVDLGRVLGRTLATIGRRFWRRAHLSDSRPGDYTPGWIRAREGDAEDEDGHEDRSEG